MVEEGTEGRTDRKNHLLICAAESDAIEHFQYVVSIINLNMFKLLFWVRVILTLMKIQSVKSQYFCLLKSMIS